MFRNQIISSLILALALLAPTATAKAQDKGWQLRVGGVWVDPQVDFLDNGDGNRIEAGSESGFGLSLGLERRFNPRVGVELGVLSAQPDVTLDANLAGGIQFDASDSVNVTAITAALNFHLTPDKKVDVYLGPLLAYATYSDLEYDIQAGGQTFSSRLTTDDDVAFGAQLGADVALGDGPWSLNLTARYLDIGLDVTDDEGEETDLDFHPLILGVGFGYRF